MATTPSPAFMKMKSRSACPEPGAHVRNDVESIGKAARRVPVDVNFLRALNAGLPKVRETP